MSYTLPHASARPQPRISYYAHGLLLLILSSWTHALQISYCSPDNTAGTNFITSIYMSNGKCQDNCQGGYAFAVLLGESCWCSNYIPATQDQNSLCDDSCPGFPDDTCGNQARGLYGYFALGKTPSGTAGASAPSSSAVATSSPSPSVSTIFVPITPGSSSRSSSVPVRSSRSSASAFSFSVDVSVLTPYVSSQSSAESSSSSLSSSTSPSAPSPPANSATSVYTSVMTVTGQATTVVITPTSTAQSSDSALGANSQASSSRGGGISGGAVAGIVVGVAIIIGLVIGGAVFFWLRRRHRKNLDAISEGGSYASPSHASKSNGGIPSRQVSQMSSAGLLTKPARMNTTGHSSNNDESRTLGMSSDRNSTHMTVDQRLNPWAIYSNEVSRASNVSLQDNQDYSRQLRVANPDP